MSGVAKKAWDVMSGVTKTAWDVMSGMTKQHGMFCPGWQIFVGCFVWGIKNGMFCPALEQYRSAELASISKQSEF